MRTDSIFVNPLFAIGQGIPYAVITSVVCNALRLQGQQASFVAAAFFVAFALSYFALKFPKTRSLLGSIGKLQEIVLVIVSALPAALCLVGYACQGFSELGATIVSFAILGIITSLQLSQWFSRISSDIMKAGPTPIIAALSCGIFISLIILLLDGSFRTVALLLLPVISSILLLITTVNAASEEVDPAPSNPIELDSRTHHVLFIYQFAASFCLSSAYQHSSVTISALTIILSFAICISFQVVRKKFTGTIGETAKVYLPLLMIMLFGTLSDSPIIASGTLVVGGVFYLYQGLSNQVFLANLAIHFKTSLPANMAVGRFPPVAGFATGMCVGIGYSFLLPQLAQNTRLIAPALIAAAVAALYAFLPFNTGNPIKEGMVSDPARGIDKPWEPGSNDEMASFKRTCTQIAEKHDFTPRESEVFQLLARGYNTESIADILVVSSSTVKTHVYRIYRKLDIHSQQDIIAQFHPEVMQRGNRRQS